jgi:hypothetical protein
MKLLELRHELALPAPELNTCLAPLMHQYKSAREFPGHTDTLRVVLRVFQKGDVNRLWQAAPQDGQPGFLKAMRFLSSAIQRTARAWTEFLWLADRQLLHDREKTLQALAYFSLRTYVPRAKDLYGYDPLESSQFPAMNRSVRNGIAAKLTSVSTLLRLRGEVEVAEYYDPANSVRFSKSVFRSPKFLWDLLDRENRMIRAWAPICGKNPDEVDFHALREKVARTWQGASLRGCDWRFVTAAIEIEVAAALEAYFGLPLTRRLEIRASPLEPVAAHEPPRVVFRRRAA